MTIDHGDSWSLAGMEYSLSVILSYLSETAGTSLLIARKLYSVRDQFHGLNVVGTPRKCKRRHRFVVSPVQDPVVLLERLNTRKLHKRRGRSPPGKTTAQLAIQEWEVARESNDSSEHPSHLRATVALFEPLQRLTGTNATSLLSETRKCADENPYYRTHDRYRHWVGYGMVLGRRHYAELARALCQDALARTHRQSGI